MLLINYLYSNRTVCLYTIVYVAKANVNRYEATFIHVPYLSLVAIVTPLSPGWRTGLVSWVWRCTHKTSLQTSQSAILMKYVISLTHTHTILPLPLTRKY